jgi:pimeloyl-ACP methyl ester carboxylesterase
MKKIKLMSLLLISGGLFAQASLAYSSSTNDCGEDTTDGISWSYCITKTKESKNPDVAYFLHGIYGSEYEWVKQNSEVVDQWEKTKQDPPTVVSISFGNVWFLVPHQYVTQESAYMETLMNSILPLLEKKIGGLTGRRMLIGRSMGGFNATELFLMYPKSFERVALICPVLAKISPFADDEAYDDFIEKSGGVAQYVNFARETAKNLFKDEASWIATDPFHLAPVALGPSFPKLYVSIGDADEFGISQDVEFFAQIAKTKRVPSVEWHSVHAGHCSFDPVALANFLVKR